MLCRQLEVQVVLEGSREEYNYACALHRFLGVMSQMFPSGDLAVHGSSCVQVALEYV